MSFCISLPLFLTSSKAALAELLAIVLWSAASSTCFCSSSTTPCEAVLFVCAAMMAVFDFARASSVCVTFVLKVSNLVCALVSSDRTASVSYSAAARRHSRSSFFCCCSRARSAAFTVESLSAACLPASAVAAACCAFVLASVLAATF